MKHVSNTLKTLEKSTILFIVFLLFQLTSFSAFAQDTDLKIQPDSREAAWLADHQEVRLGVDPEFVPFEFIDDEGHYLGMCKEYVMLLQERLGIKMLVTRGLTWKEAVEKAKAREIDVLPCVGMTEERKEFFNYTQPYLSFFRVIITRRDAPAYDTLEALKTVKVGVQQNSSHHGYIQDHSDLEPILFDTFEKALLAVSNGNIDAAVGNEAVAAYTINKNNIINLTMTRLAGAEPKNLYLAVRNDWPELVSLLNKGLDSITDEEKSVIENKWIALKVEKEIDYALVAKVAGVILFFVVILVLWNIQISFYIQRE
jgi:ABC-type amino acid transport substrate-binding protein